MFEKVFSYGAQSIEINDFPHGKEIDQKHIRGLWKTIDHRKFSVRRSIDLVVVSSDM